VPDGDPAQLDEVRRRLLELEERLDATEYQVKRDRERQLGKPPI
jgi:tetrahydromethanopterin S-methyltransferase subunit G